MPGLVIVLGRFTGDWDLGPAQAHPTIGRAVDSRAVSQRLYCPSGRIPSFFEVCPVAHKITAVVIYFKNIEN